MSLVLSAPSIVAATICGTRRPPSSTVSCHSTGLYWLSDTSNISDHHGPGRGSRDCGSLWSPRQIVGSCASAGGQLFSA